MEEKTKAGAAWAIGPTPDELAIDHLLWAALKRIPPASEPWPMDQRVKWFRLFADCVAAVYDRPNEMATIEVAEAPSGR